MVYIQLVLSETGIGDKGGVHTVNSLFLSLNIGMLTEVKFGNKKKKKIL